MLVFNVRPGITIVYAPLILLVEFVLILGLSLGLASLNVYYRDVQYIWAVFLQAGFFASPIIYPISIIPQKYFWIIKLNPMTPIIDMLRGSVIYSTFPVLMDVAFIIVAALVILAAGYMIFLKLEPEFAEAM